MDLKPQIVFLMLIVMLVTVAPVPALQDSVKQQDEVKVREERTRQALAVIDEIIRDGQSLRLPENRFHIFVQTASALWSMDEKRARVLFKNALASFKELQSAIENADPQYAYLSGFAPQLRSELFSAVSQRDPELALEVLRATRQNNDGKLSVEEANYESQMELQLARMIAAKDPAKALELAEQGLAKGVSQEVLNIINVMSATNLEVAQKLFDETLVRLRTENYAANPTAAYVALNLLQGWIQRHNQTNAQTLEAAGGIQRLNFNDAAARDLCNVLLQALFDNSSNVGPTSRVPWANSFDLSRQLQPLLPVLEKLVPSQAATWQGRVAEMQRYYDLQNGPWAKVQELINNAPVNDLLEAAGKSQPDVQNHLLQSAAWKAFNEGDSNLARQIVQEKITDRRMRQDMLGNMDRQLIDRRIGEGKLAEARALLARLPSDAERANFLTRLATMALDKGDKNEAQQLLNEAQALMSNRAENYQALYAQLQMAYLYQSFDPPRGYAIIESAIDRLNELTAAAATLNGFDIQQYFRSNEFVLSNGNQLSQLLQQVSWQINLVALKDADRARTLADRLERLEMRTWACLAMVQALLSDNSQSKNEIIRLVPGSRDFSYLVDLRRSRQ